MYKFKLNKRNFNSPKNILTGDELLQIAGLPQEEDYELFKKVGDREFEPIQPNETVDLGEPGLEKFYVRRRFEIPYLLDDEYYSTHECLITPTELLEANGFDPKQFYLKQIDGHREISYKNSEDQSHEISLRPHMRFITCKKSPTPVSFTTHVGVMAMEDQLKELGYETYQPKPDMVAFKFLVPHGRFKDKEVEVALHAPQFPNIPPTGPHIKPLLLPAHTGGTHPTGGIHLRNIPTSEWQYWSRPFRDWNTTDKTMKTYISFLRTLFDFQ